MGGRGHRVPSPPCLRPLDNPRGSVTKAGSSGPQKGLQKGTGLPRGQATLQSWLPATPGPPNQRLRPAECSGQLGSAGSTDPGPRLHSVHLVCSGAPEALWPQPGS